MNQITINPFIENLSVNIGFQNDHNKTELVFDGLNTIENKVFYLDLSLSTTEHQLIPLVDNKWIVTSTFTDKARVFNAQIVEKIDDKMIGHSPIFQLRVRHSIDGTEKIKEVVPPAFKNEYDKMVNVTTQIKEAYDKGELKGDKGAEGKSAYQVALDNGYEGTEQQWLDSLKYQHSEEFTQLANEVRSNAEKAENSKNLASQSAAQAEQSKQATQTLKNEVDTKVSQFNDNVESQNQVLDSKLQQAYTNIGESVKQATEQADRAEQATSSKLDKNQGIENKGKVLIVGDDGNVTVDEIVGGDGIPIINTMSGASPLEVPNSAERVNKGFNLIGNTAQNQSPPPSPNNPQEIKNVGKYDELSGKYKIDITITNAKDSWSKEQTVTLTSDRPITKWDKLIERNGQIGWLYRSRIINSFDGVGYDIQLGKQPQNNITHFTVMFTDARRKGATSTIDLFVSKYQATPSSFTKYEIATCCNWNDGVKYFSSPQSGIVTVKQFKAWLEENPLTIAYETERTEFIPLSNDEQNAIRILQTYYPTTVITADGGEVIPTVEITYVADTKNYIDQKIAKIEKTVVETQKALL